MAKITITVEDKEQGRVKITADPSFETIAKMINSGEETTSAHGYAMAMVNHARKESKAVEPETKIWLPKVKRI